jgi:ribonuclease P protein component
LKNFSLAQNERVKKKSDFEKIYSAANVLFSSDRLLKVHFLCVDSEISEIKIAAAVSKKSGKAVWRNRVKRIIKDAYRINKPFLLKSILNKKVKLLLVFSPNRLSEASNKKIYLRDISPGVVELMNKIIQQI